MKRTRAPYQAPGGHGIGKGQMVHSRVEQRLCLAFHPLHRPKLGSAPTARVGTIERGATERTTIHRSGLEIEQQILKLSAPVLQGPVVAAASGVSDHLDQADDLCTILLG